MLFNTRFEIPCPDMAEKVMADANAQIHIGPHNITDDDDPDGYLHQSYDEYIKKWLKSISDRIQAWSHHCAFCDKKDGSKPQTTYRVHDVLDRLSNHLEGEITGSEKSWRIFLSKYALDYHKPVCNHKRFEP